MKKIVVLVLILVFSSCSNNSGNIKTNSGTTNSNINNSGSVKNNESFSGKTTQKKEEIKDIDLEKEKYYDEVDNIFEVLNFNNKIYKIFIFYIFLFYTKK